MATSNKTTTSRGVSSKSGAASSRQQATKEMGEEASVATPTPEPVTEAPAAKITPKAASFSPEQMITVYNGFQGSLVYRTPRTGEIFKWGAFGDEQEISVADLRAAKNSYKKFFINNWFMFDDPEIIEYLGMSQYYRHALKLKEFDTFFDESAEEMGRRIRLLSAGQKKSLAYRAKQLIADGTIDSIKKINTLEEALGVELIEH